MLFSLVAVSCLLAVHATPLSYIPELGMDIMDDVVGTGLGMGSSGRGMVSGGRGVGTMGGVERSGSEYGRNDRVGSSSGYGSRGYEREGGSSSHDAGHLDRDFKQITESHVSEGHDSGHHEGYGSRGGESGGHRRYGAEGDEFGGRYYTGLDI